MQSRILAANLARQQRSARDQLALRGVNAGFKFNPIELDSKSPVTQALQGVAGKVLPLHAAIEHNQEKVNQVVRDSIPDFGGRQLSLSGLEDYVETTIDSHYTPLRGLGITSDVGDLRTALSQYTSSDKLAHMAGEFGGDYSIALKPVKQLIGRLGGKTAVSAEDFIALISDQRKQASALYRGAANPNNAAGSIGMGYQAASRQALADVLEDYLGSVAQKRASAIDAWVGQIGQTVPAPMQSAVLQKTVADLQAKSAALKVALPMYQEGRQRLARVLKYQTALEGGTDINPQQLGRMSNRGAVFDPGVQMVADLANTFSRDFAPYKRLGGAQKVSMVDTITGLVGGISASIGGVSAPPALLIGGAMAAARPTVRAGLMSKTYQRAMVDATPKLPGILTDATRAARPVINAAGTRSGISVFQNQ